MTDTQIPREAVAAAARALGNHINVDFDLLGPVEQLEARETAVAALNAAAPHLLATRDVEVQTLTAQRDEAWAEIKHLSKLLDERDAKERATIASHQLRPPCVFPKGSPEPVAVEAVTDEAGFRWNRAAQANPSQHYWRRAGWGLMGRPTLWTALNRRQSLTEVFDTEAGVDEPAKSAEPRDLIDPIAAALSLLDRFHTPGDRGRTLALISDLRQILAGA